MRTILQFLLCATALRAGELNPVVRAWRVNPRAAAAPPGLRIVLPDVHSVHVDGRFVYAESAGLALESLGPLEANGKDPVAGVRHFVFRFPLRAEKAEFPTPTPFGVVGAFIDGVPLYNPTSALSYRDQNLWHLDAVASASPQDTPLLSALLQKTDRHSPLIGFAFDGYPIYGPWGSDGTLTRFRSGYRLRQLTRRTTLPDGTELTPSQEGPPVDSRFPLGTFIEDYEYVRGSGDLDEHNGRSAVTPDYPEGTYAYFLSTDAGGHITYPYLVGPSYYGKTESGLSSTIDTPPLDARDEAHIRLATPARLEASQPQTLTFTLRDAQGRKIRFPEKVHECAIHLAVVSEDLKEFAHIHPELQLDDTFAVTHTFPHGGDYWLFADYTLPGAGSSISRFRIHIEGKPRHSLPEESPGSLRVTLTPPRVIETGQDLTFRFDAVDAKTGQPVHDLQPYLGAWAHIMIVSEDKLHFIHAHPLENPALATDTDPWRHTHSAPGPGPSGVATVTGFRDPGRYRIWVQFRRDGEVITFPFAIEVRAGHELAPGGARSISTDSIRISVSRGGFQPSRIVGVAGKPLSIAFERKDAENCAAAVIFPELNIRKELPAGQTTVVVLPASGPREYSFSCGMKMYRGAVVIR